MVAFCVKCKPNKVFLQVVVDEIHERDSFADFLLIILRDVLPQHPQLRVVLMSATLHIDLFSAYFGACPVIQVCCALSRVSASQRFTPP